VLPIQRDITAEDSSAKSDSSDIVHIGSLNPRNPSQYTERQRQYIDKKCWEYFGYANVWIDEKEANGHYHMYCKQVPIGVSKLQSQVTE